MRIRKKREWDLSYFLKEKVDYRWEITFFCGGGDTKRWRREWGERRPELSCGGWSVVRLVLMATHSSASRSVTVHTRRREPLGTHAKDTRAWLLSFCAGVGLLPQHQPTIFTPTVPLRRCTIPVLQYQVNECSGWSKLLFHLLAPKFHLIYCSRIEDISDTKLLKTNITLDLS